MSTEKYKRLRRNEDIVKVVRSKERQCHKIINIFFLSNSFNYSRFSVSVSKKISNRAVQRNKIRRQIKAIITQEKILVPKTDAVVVVKNDWDVNNFEGNKKILCSLFKKELLRRERHGN